MKDYTREQIFDGRPEIEPKKAIDYCIDQLVADKNKKFTDEVAIDFSYEELLGALLLVKDEIERLEEEVDFLMEDNE